MHVSNELKLLIAEALDPPTCFNFAITCKDHWTICEPVIQKHARLATDHYLLDLGDPAVHLWKILVEILDGSPLYWYIRKISIPHEREELLVEEKNVEPDADSLEKINRVAQEIDARYESKPQEDEYGTFMFREMRILIHYLPQLKILSVATVGNRKWIPSGRLTEMARASMSHARVPSMPFQRLETLVISCPDFLDGASTIAGSQDLLYIPSLKFFVGINIGGHVASRNSGNFRFPQSNLKEIVLEHSKIYAPSLRWLLSRTKSLESFSYHGYRPGGDDRMDPKGVINALLEYAGDSLKHLHLDSQDMNAEMKYPDGQDVSLRGFKKLETLRCDYKLLLPRELLEIYWTKDVDADKRFDLHTALPKSLEALHLEGLDSRHEWRNVTRNFLGEVEHKTQNDLTPNLKSIFIEGDGGDWAMQTGKRGRLPDIIDNPLMMHITEPECYDWDD